MMIQRILIVVVVVWLAGSSGLMAMGRMELGTSEPAPLNEWNAFKAFLAQAPDGERLRGGVTEQGEELKRRHRHIEQLRILKMLELLDLAEDQEFEFLTAFRQTRREQRGL